VTINENYTKLNKIYKIWN